MMTKLSLAGIRVALLATDGVEQVALTTPRAALDAAHALTRIVAPRPDRIVTWNGDRWGAEFAVDVPLVDARAEDFDALLIPSGVMSRAALHADPAAIAFVRAFDLQDKPIAAICDGAWLLAVADVVRGRRVASWPTMRGGLRDAGAHWTTAHVAVDGRLLTCRSATDLASFMQPTIARFANIGGELTH